jgi:hypothetical protein
MNARMAAPVILTVSLVVLMSGCAGAAAQGGQVNDYLRPAENAAALGIARGHVIAQEELSPNQVVADRVERAIEQAAQSDAARSFSADARRELHSQAVQAEAAPSFSADARRELHSQPVEQATVRWSPDARRELHAGQPVTTTVEQSFSAAAMRELKGSAPTEPVDDVLSPIRGDDSAPTPQGDPVDDVLSPLGGEN